MKKKLFFICFACMCMMTTSAQTLFTYGKFSVDAKEFLRAYNKNNSQPSKDKSKAMREYLDLYINSKLKIREAYDRKYDTLPQVMSEVENLRKQIAENYMNDPQVTPRLQREAFERSLKDIRVAHIFISFRKGDDYDTVAARTKKDEVLARLQKGDDFSEIAKQYSDDAAAKTNGGEIGYITVFTLPYEFESAIYRTPVGKISPVITSRSGYHIFKNMGERKALGKMKAKQILLAIPPGSDEAAIIQIARLADSLFNAIKNGADFGLLATRFSNDYVSAANSGTMPDISVGEYNPEFESKVWSLSKDGELSKPFLTSHGWHIVQRVAAKSVVTDSSNSTNKQELLSKIMNDARWKSSRAFVYKKVIDKPGIKKYAYDDVILWSLADSMILLTPMKDPKKAPSLTMPIFKLGDSSYTVINFINYATINRFQPSGSIKPYPQIRDEYIQSVMYKYYQDHLDSYSEDFRNQMAEFRDGNIFFEIMQQDIWNKAQNDTSALKALYEKNKNKYTWKKSAEAVIFYCSDEATGKFIYDELKKNPSLWRTVTEQYAEKVVADSSRFEWEQLPLETGTIPRAGQLTKPIVNTNDNSASFAYIINVSQEELPRSYAEAKGLVINDYQEMLEANWAAVLRKKYPVKVNEKVFQQISR